MDTSGELAGPASLLIDWTTVLADKNDRRVQDWLALEPVPLTVTLVDSAYSSGTNCHTTHGEFFRCLTRRYRQHVDKKLTRGFAPCELIDDTPADKGKNLQDGNVKAITLGVADFESKNGYVPTVEDIRRPLDARGIAYVIKTSFSHDPTGPKGARYRCIFPFSAAIPVTDPRDAAAYSEAYRRLHALFGWKHDLTCANPSRYYHDGFYLGPGPGQLFKAAPRRADGAIDLQAITRLRHAAIGPRAPLVIFQPGRAF